MKDYTKKIGMLLLVAVIFCVPLFVNAAYKIETIDDDGSHHDFVIGPGKVELTLSPGESATRNLIVTNRMGDTRIFNIAVEDFKGSRVPGETIVLLGDAHGPYSLRDYISVSDYSFELKTGERATVPVTISIPSDSEPGGHYGSVLISTATKQTEGTKNQAAQSTIVSRIGTLFFVRIPGSTDEDGKLTYFTTKNDQSLFFSGPVSFDAVYENNGTVHLNPYGQVVINNIIGQEVGRVPVDPWFSMPDSLRSREVSWDKKVLFGRYTAIASINRGYGNIVDTDQVTFWVLPWKIIVPIFAGIIILVVIVRFVFSRFEFKRK